MKKYYLLSSLFILGFFFSFITQRYSLYTSGDSKYVVQSTPDIQIEKRTTIWQVVRKAIFTKKYSDNKSAYKNSYKAQCEESKSENWTYACSTQRTQGEDKVQTSRPYNAEKKYSQKPLIDLMKVGAFPGETRKPKYIEKATSNVFLFENKVYKFFKNDRNAASKGFEGLTDKKKRFSFTKKDYEWNRTLSPSTYIRLASVAVRDGSIVEVDREEDAEEIIQVMHKLDTKDILYDKLLRNEITKRDCFEIGKQFGERMKKVQVRLPEKGSFYDILKVRISLLRAWIGSIPEHISEEEAHTYCDYLNEFRIANRAWLDGELTDEVVADGDFYTQNIVYSNKKLYLMDTYAPKEAWRVSHKLLSLYRVAVDVWALSDNKEYFEALIAGYEVGNDIKVNRKLDDFYIIWAAAIATPLLYFLQKTDGVNKESVARFHKFLREYYKMVNRPY